MKELVFLLEEVSAQAMLEGLLPNILPLDVTLRFIGIMEQAPHNL